MEERSGMWKKVDVVKMEEDRDVEEGRGTGRRRSGCVRGAREDERPGGRRRSSGRCVAGVEDEE